MSARLVRSRSISNSSVDIALVTPAGFEFLDVFRRGFLGASSSSSHDFVERVVDIFGHAVRVPADVKMSALLEPVPQLGRVLEHPVLDIDFEILVAGERRIEPGQDAVPPQRLQFIFVEKIAARFLRSEKQPVAAFGPSRSALLQKCAERRNACAGTNHDDRRVAVLRQPEMLGALNENRYRRIFADALS